LFPGDVELYEKIVEMKNNASMLALDQSSIQKEDEFDTSMVRSL